MKNTIYRRFLFLCSLLIWLNILLIIFNHWGLGTLNSEEECVLMNSDNLFVSMVFTAVDVILTFLEVLDVLGIVNFIFFGILVNETILKNLEIKTILLTTITTSLLSYFMLYIPDIRLGFFWYVISLKSIFLFSVLPTVTVVTIKYILGKIREKYKSRDKTPDLINKK